LSAVCQKKEKLLTLGEKIIEIIFKLLIPKTNFSKALKNTGNSNMKMGLNFDTL